jgi:hypothetical protein
MRTYWHLSALAVLWALIGAPGSSQGVVHAATGTPVIENDASPGEPEGLSLVGQVTEINHASGEFVLTTAAGPLRLVAPPEDLKDIKIGDVLQLALVDDESH